MKKKIIFSILVLFMLLSIISINTVFADTEVAKIGATLSKETILKGEEVDIVISANEINEGIAGMTFSVNYDDTLFDFVSKTDGDIWTSSKLENSYTILTESFEATTQTGNIITIKLKAKDTITADKQDTISITDIELSKDDASTASVADIIKNITVKVSNGNSGDNPETNTVNTNTTNTNTTNTNTTNTNTTNTNTTNTNTTNTNTTNTNTTNTNTTNTNTTNTNTTSTNTAIINITNTNVTNINTTSTNATTTTDSKLPKTGEEDYIILIGSAVVAIIGAISYIRYKRNKI